MREVLNDPQRYAESVTLLRSVLEGDSYQAVGQRHDLTRSAVERRIKALAEHLVHNVGVDGLSLVGVAFARRLRLHRAAVEKALEQVPYVARSSLVSPLSREALQQAAQQVRVHSPHVAHDLALFYVLFTTGMRPLELARLTVRDCVSETGKILRTSELRAEVTNHGKPRPLCLNSAQLTAALEAYLHERQRRGHGVGDTSCYGGLCPNSPLFLNPYGRPYVLQVNHAQGVVRHRCRGMQAALRKLFRHAGLPALSSQDARVTASALLYDAGADESQVGLLLGIRDNSAVRALLRRPRPGLAELTQNLL